MPHSPVWYGDRLWVLNSGHGALCTVDLKNGQLTEVARFPGYTRGLAFMGKYAFVGTSCIREKSTFGGMPIESLKEKIRCGVYLVDIESGKQVGMIEFNKGIEELFDICVLGGATSPYMVGIKSQDIEQMVALPAAGTWIVISEECL